MHSYLLDVADFPENSPRQLSRGRKFSAMDRRMQKTPLAKNDNLLLIDVNSEIRMHPAGRDGPSLTFSDMEPLTRFGIDLHPGGKGLPSLRMDGDGWEKISNMVRSDDVNSLDPRVVCPRDPAIHGALTSTTLGEAVDGEKRDPKEIVRKLHVNWGHASAQQLKRTMVEADGRASSLVQYVDEVVRNCEVCRAFDMAPSIPIAGASTVSAFNEKLQVDLLFLGEHIVLHVLEIFPRYSLMVPARSKNPEEV